MAEKFILDEAQWEKINSALLIAASVCIVHAKEVHEKMLNASFIMDDIVEAAEMAEAGPLSSYPEDWEALISLCDKVLKKGEPVDETAACTLADQVRSICQDELGL